MNWLRGLSYVQKRFPNILENFSTLHVLIPKSIEHERIRLKDITHIQVQEDSSPAENTAGVYKEKVIQN